MATIPASAIVDAIRDLLTFPYDRVCRHYVACNLLSVLESHGIVITEDLARSVVECDDETALRELDVLTTQVTP